MVTRTERGIFGIFEREPRAIVPNDALVGTAIARSIPVTGDRAALRLAGSRCLRSQERKTTLGPARTPDHPWNSQSESPTVRPFEPRIAKAYGLIRRFDTTL